jgi:hypothetical protein
MSCVVLYKWRACSFTQRTVNVMPTPNEDGYSGQQRGEPPPDDALHDLKDGAKALFGEAREQGVEQLEKYRETAAAQMDNLARSTTSAAEELQDKDTLGLSHYISGMAESLTDFAGNLRGKSADELLQQVGRLARENPALFVTGSIALGFGLSRFLKASSPDLTTSETSTQDKSNPDNGVDDPGKTDFDPRIAADEELVTPPPHTGDVMHSGAPGIPDSFPPSAGQPMPEHSSAESGIQQSGAEMGSFDEAAKASPMQGGSNETASRGER